MIRCAILLGWMGVSLLAQSGPSCTQVTLGWLIGETKSAIARGEEVMRTDRSFGTALLSGRWSEIRNVIDRCGIADSAVWNEEFGDLLILAGMPADLADAVQKKALSVPVQCPSEDGLGWHYFLTTAIVSPDAAIREVRTCGLSQDTPRDLEDVLQVAGLDSRVLEAAAWMAPTQKSRRNPRDQQVYVKVPAGTLAGTEIPEFWLGETEVTREAWARYTRGTVSNEERLLPFELGYGKRPNSFSIFCSFIGGRLPTQREFLYAQRGRRKSLAAISAGVEIPSPIDRYAWTSRNSGGVDRPYEIPKGISRSKREQLLQNRRQPVGLKLPNAFGIYDLLGNVDELLEDQNTFSHYSGCSSADWCDSVQHKKWGFFPWTGFRCVWEKGTPAEE